MLDTVLDPAIKDPRAPTKESTSGQAPWKMPAMAVAMAMGIPTMPSGLLPDCIMIRTMGTAKIRAIMGFLILLRASDQAAPTCLPFIPNRGMQSRATRIKGMIPGL